MSGGRPLRRIGADESWYLHDGMHPYSEKPAVGGHAATHPGYRLDVETPNCFTSERFEDATFLDTKPAATGHHGPDSTSDLRAPSPDSHNTLLDGGVVGDTERRRAHMQMTWWLPEILSQVGGMLCLLAIIILLWWFNGRHPPNMQLGITLNTLLAFLTSLAKVAFLVPLVEGIGQLKWMWFLSRKHRPLIDMQVFDEATQGGLGGVKLLFRFRGFMASFGALLMMSGLFTSTLTQQAIEYRVIEEVSANPNEKAFVERATVFSLYDGNGLAIAPYDTAREQRAIFQGVFTAPTEEVPQVKPTCPTGKCTWPAYGSLAVCGGVANLTAVGDDALLKNLNNKTEKRLGVLFDTSKATAEALGYGQFYFGSVPVVFPVVVSPLDKPTGAFNRSVTDLMLSDSFVAYTDELLNNSATFDMSKIKYLEVALWWCTKSYETSVTGGIATTREIGTRSQLKNTPSTLNLAWSSEFYPCYTSGTCNKTYGASTAQLEPPPGIEGAQDNFTIHLWSELTASALLAASMFDSVFMDRTRGVVASNGGGVAKSFGLSVLGDFLSTKSPPPEAQMENMRKLVANTARATTNLVREGNTRLNKTDSTAFVSGSVMSPQTFVHVRWEWLGMLASQLVLTAVFLAFTMLSTRRAHMQVIKCSSLATLCALDKTTRQHVGGINDLDSLEQKAKMLGVHLERNSSGVALWLGVRRSDGTVEGG